jgi:hypothetical protein
MRVSQRLSALGVLAFAIGALAFLTAPIASLSPTIAQPTTNTTTSEEGGEGGTSTTEEHGHSNETATAEGTFTVRDSVFASLADHTIPASGFIHLYDTTPYYIKNGHVAVKIPCDEDSAPLLDVLVGVAPDMAPATLELVANLSTPGELCLYHHDLPETEQGNVTSANSTATSANATTMITDIALSNPGDEDITLPATSTVVIGINEIARGTHSHAEEEEQQPV